MLRIILTIVFVLLCIAMTVIVLMQEAARKEMRNRIF